MNSGVNLFLGSNGIGKTNLIEAVAMLTTGLSPRGADNESMVQWNCDGFFVQGVFESGLEAQNTVTLEMKYRPGGPRQIRENGQTVIRLKELVGRVPLVSFVPEDLSLVKGEPDLRRRAMNMVLMQVDAAYAEALRRYQEALKARNAAIKQLAEGQITADALAPWDSAVVDTGLIICQKRDEFIRDFSDRAGEVQERISGGKDKMALEYRPSVPGPWDQSGAERWHEMMRNARYQELAMGMTLSGPQRDDVMFLLNGRAAKSYASEGQLRTCAVAFKLAEIPYIQERRGQKPICLLDDVLSELDAERAHHLLDELSRTGQCFVTLTGLESWPKDRALPAAIFNVTEKGVEQNTNEPATLIGERHR